MPLITECCGVQIADDWRYCPSCGWEARVITDREMKPKVVCLCGSTRFEGAFKDAMLHETLAGKIVLTVGCMTHSDEQLGAMITPEIKEMLDELHKRKIDIADEVLILNVGGYIGSSTRSERDYAIAHAKPVRYLEG